MIDNDPPARPRERTTRGVMPTIREQIEPYLRAAGIKPTAEASGVNRVSLQHWLAGRRRMSDQQIEAVCRALRLKIKIGRRRPPSARRAAVSSRATSSIAFEMATRPAEWV